MYRCVADARLDMTRTGQVIMDDGLPRQLGPMIFVFTGTGNVTKVRIIYRQRALESKKDLAASSMGHIHNYLLHCRVLFTFSNACRMNGLNRMI
jgi:hypothetical protein